MRRHSPYNYAFNNPIRFIDPDGMMPYTSNPNRKTDDGSTELTVQNPFKMDVIATGSSGDGDKKIYEGRTLPEFTLEAPRAFDGVLGRAADLWMSQGLEYSTYGRIGFNYNRPLTSSISVFEGNGFYVNGITPLGGLAFELEKVKYTGDNGRKTSEWFFTTRFGWGLDVGLGVMATKYNTLGNSLMIGNIEGTSAHVSFLNYQSTNSINLDPLEFGSTTGHSISIGISPAFPVKVSGSVGIGYTINIAKYFRGDYNR